MDRHAEKRHRCRGCCRATRIGGEAYKKTEAVARSRATAATLVAAAEGRHAAAAAAHGAWVAADAAQKTSAQTAAAASSAARAAAAAARAYRLKGAWEHVDGKLQAYTVANGKKAPGHPNDASGKTAHYTEHGYWYDFTHPDAKWDNTTQSQACDCRPGFHEAKDVVCHVDAFGHLRVKHPEMACAGAQWRHANPTVVPYGALNPDKCALRYWTGTGSTYHHCKFTSSTTCTCCPVCGLSQCARERESK